MASEREYKFKNSKSCNGTFSCHIKQDVNEMLTMYCRIKNLNKTKFVNDELYKILNEKFEKGLKGI